MAIQRFDSVVREFLSSRALFDRAFNFLQALEDATCDVCEHVIEVSEKLVAYNREQQESESNYHLNLHQLTKSLKHEYATSENRPHVRKRLLDLIDQMLEQELYGTDDIINAHERD